MQENRVTEFKERVSQGFLKTVSAFANFGTGKIMFGIRDDGSIAGIRNPDKVCLDIENSINDSIRPKPDFSFSIDRATEVITLEVREGAFKPYLYKGKAYRRSGTSTVEVDPVELRRLVIAGENLSFEALASSTQDLSFDFFFRVLKETLHLENVSKDVLKTLGFYTKQEELNQAAALFADRNDFGGIDIVRFGDSINEILDRETLQHRCILESFERAMHFFDKYYGYEKIEGMERKRIERIPREAFRESLANAMVHRVWDMPSHIRIAMYADAIEIYSPGGLPCGINEEEYLKGYISRLRNPIVAGVFYRLHWIEMFGTGIRRIRDCYEAYGVKPDFKFSENAIIVTLPTSDRKVAVNSDEKIVWETLSSGLRLSTAEIAEKTGFGKSKVIRLLNALIEKRYVRKEGSGRGTRYCL